MNSDGTLVRTACLLGNERSMVSDERERGLPAKKLSNA